MGYTFSSTVLVTLSRFHTNQVDDDGPTTTDNTAWILSDYLGNGTGNDQATMAFQDIRTLAASTTESLDLTGSLRDAFGRLITFTSLKCIVVKHKTVGADAVMYVGGGPDAVGGFVTDPGDRIAIRPGGKFLWWGPKAGAPVTDNSADKLRIVNNATGAIEYEILLLGTHNA